MAQGVHITANAIRQLGKDPVVRRVVEAMIGSPGFGLSAEEAPEILGRLRRQGGC